MHRLLALLALLPSPLLAEPTEVIHILNYHHVSRDDYEQDVWSQDEHPVKGRGIYVSPVKEKKIIPILRFPDRFQMEINKHQKELYERYSAFLDNIEAIQGQQVTVLRSLIKKHSLKGVYLEGLTEKNHERTMKIIETIKKDEKTKSKKDEKAKPKPNNPDDEFGELTFDSLSKAADDEYFNAFIAPINKTHLLELGAAGQLVVKGELKTLLPAEDSMAFQAANPFLPDGKIVFNKKADKAREDAIVRNLLKGDGVVVIILGGAHDLSDNLERLAKGVKYTRVTVPKFIEIMNN